mmetsp:Transcript_12316/g.26896  ORF Transcript_12316/g.26896 Transcript_12316/m.26896 type:complete len:1235 (-) Transcript_12316:86-3790(-)
MSSSSSIIDQPILNPSTYDPARYGWTAIGGISSILDPHSAALRPESRVAFLKRMKENSGGVEECYYTILEPGEDETAAVNNSDNNNVVEEKGKTPVREGTRSSSRKSKGSSGCSNSNNTSSSFDTTTNDTDNINNSDSNKPPKKEKEEATITATTTTTDPPPKKVLIHSTSQQQPTIDIYTYHRGRAGYEPRHFKTGELLCGTDPVDTNYGWAPGKSLCKVVVKFALGDGGEGEEYGDSDEEDGGEVEGVRSCGGTVEDRKVDGDLGNEGGDAAAAADCDKDLPSRGTPSPNNKQSQQQQQQQYSGHSTPAHSAPSTPSPPSYSAHHQLQLRHRLADSETELLSQWPPSHQVVLDSPEVSQRSRRYSYKYHHASSNSIGNNSNGGQQHRSKPSKSMSMVLLDIAPGESRGPSMIPFAEDLDAYDEMDGDSVAGGCGDRRNNNEGGESGKEVNSSSSSNSSRSEEGGTPLDGGERESQSRKNKVAATPTLSPHGQSSHEPSPSSERSNESSTARGQGRRLSSSLKQDTKSARESNLECQAYTATHLEALRLRHEAGKGRAYSFNDSLLQGGARSPESSYRNHIEKTTASASKSGERKEKLPTISSPKQWKPTFDVLNAEHKSTMSTDTFVEVVSPLIVKKVNSDLMVPILTPSKEASTDEAAADVRRKDSVSCNASSKSKKSATEMTKSASAPAATTVPVAPSTSLTSVATIETAKTIKSGTSNHSSSSKLRAGSVSSYGRDRSLSIMSEKDGTTGASNTTGNSNNNATSKNTKPCQQQQSDVKSKQTMKEYVINDLLNIDSRHQDGSATEDIDANMEEFLRIPSKLENLMVFSLAVCVDSFLYVWTMLPLKVIWAMVCLVCTILRPGKGIGGLMFHRRHLYAVLQIMLVWFVYEQVLCPISIGKLYHWIRGQAMLKLYVLIAIVEVFDRLLCSFGQDAWDSLYWNTTRRPRHPRMLVSMIVVGVYVTVHSLFLFVHVATLSVAVNSADNALLTLLISGNFAEIKSTVFKKYNKQNLFKITTSDICERFKLALFLLLILLLNCFQGEMSKSMVFDYYSMCGIVLVAELISDWIKHSFITKFNFIKSTAYFDYALILSGDVTGIGHEGLNLDYTHAAVKRIGLAQIPLVCVTARYLHEAVRFAIAFRGNGDVDHPMSALADLITDGNKWKFYSGMFGGMVALVSFKIGLGVCIRFIARRNLGGDVSVLKRKSSTPKATTNKEGGASRADKEAKKNQ